MDIKYYMCKGTDIENSFFYPLTVGISKVSLYGKASYYSGTYLSSGAIFKTAVADNQYLTFEGVYKKNSSLYEYFINAYFKQNDEDRVSIVCEVGDIIYYTEGRLEIRKLESDINEIKTEGAVFFDRSWMTGVIGEIKIAEEGK